MSVSSEFDLAAHVRSIPDFPKPGILFRDITPLLAHPAAFRETIRRLAERYRGEQVDVVAAAEARGFIFAAPLALELNAGFVPVRKPGKLPFETRAFRYELEYGSDTLEVHTDGFVAGQRVLLVDDLLATGGTAHAASKLVELLGAIVDSHVFLVELAGLGGRDRLAGYDVHALIRYE